MLGSRRVHLPHVSAHLERPLTLWLAHPAIKTTDKAQRAAGIAIERLSAASVRAEFAAIQALYASIQKGRRLQLITLAVGYYIGFDKVIAAAGVPIYLRLLHAVIEDAISMGARWVSFGRTALEPKHGSARSLKPYSVMLGIASIR